MIVDEIIRAFPSEAERKNFAELVRSPGLMFLKIQNVADYLGTSAVGFNSLDDFPNLAPPWPAFWMEYRRKGAACGTLAVGDRIDTRELFIDSTKVHWIFVLHHFTTQSGGNPGSFMEILALDASGKLIRGAVNRDFMDALVPNAPDMVKEISELPGFVYHKEINVYVQELGCPEVLAQEEMMAITFCHCKNVKVRPDSLPEKLQKKRSKGGRVPVHRYYTLDIEPMKRVLTTDGRSREIGLKRALHICRGHFADYTDGRGLFGRHHGMFWVPQHVKGDARTGSVIKDYDVKAPSLIGKSFSRPFNGESKE
jgi:hypothetical protein